MSDLIQKARNFAEYWFVKQDQRRKYTNDPYMVHPDEVVALAKTVPHDDNMLCAGYLHDTVEDTPVTIDMIYHEFNQDIGDMVGWLTDVSTPDDGPRAKRKAIDRAHAAEAPARPQTLKLCDVISNSRSILKFDPHFASVYIPEKKLLLDVLTKGDRTLHKIAQGIVDDYYSLKVGAVVYHKLSAKEEGIVTSVEPAFGVDHGCVTVLYPDGVPPMLRKSGKPYKNRPGYYVEHYVYDTSQFKKAGLSAVTWSREQFRQLKKRIDRLDQNNGQVQLAQEELMNLRLGVAIQKAEIRAATDPHYFDDFDDFDNWTNADWALLESDLKKTEAENEEVAKAAKELNLVIDKIKSAKNQ